MPADDRVDRGCDLCGSLENKLITVEFSYPIVLCSKCGFIYVSSIPLATNGKVVDQIYGGTEDEIEDIRQRYQAVTVSLLDELEKYATGGNLLDVGCGYGFFLKAAQTRGWNVFGTDFSEIAVDHAKRLTGSSNFLISDVCRDLFGNVRFDAINLTNVLEHVPSPTETLQACRSLLLPGGILTIRVPNMTFSSIRHRLEFFLKAMRVREGAGEHCYLSSPPPFHLSGFSGSTLRQLFRKVGLETVEIKPSKLSSVADESFVFRYFESLFSVVYFGSGRSVNLSPTLLAIAKASEEA